jgi:SAM-dependent methyltransferase
MDNRYGGYDQHAFIAEYYDATYNPGPVDDIPFFVDYARQAKGRILELGCGTGRVLITTAQAGCDITGLDLSSYMLAKCREQLALQSTEIQRRVKLIQGDMTNFSTGETYSLITIPSRSFELLITVEEQLACLQCIHQHLKSDGLFLVDFFSPNPTPQLPQIEPQGPAKPAEIMMPDGCKVIRLNRISRRHPEQQYNEIEILYIITYPDGHMEHPVQAFPFRSFYRYEVEHLLSLCGFRVTNLYGNFDKTPFTADSPEMIFVARKR